MNITFLLGLPTLVLLLLLSLPSPAISCTEQEKSSLLQFIGELSPDSGINLTRSWQNGTSCCMWEGVTCSSSNGTVTELSLPSMGLEGYISPSLANLTGLRRLDLSRNSLSGGLPLELMSSGSIVFLDVSFNRLNGALQEFPSTLPYHPLQVLNISNNFFAVEFPSTIWEKKKDLVAIDASHNSFIGELPSSFCISSPSFAVLDISYNLFSGSIPTGIGKCSALRVLKAENNNITGTLPDELFDAAMLEHLSFLHNDLEGRLDGAQIIKLLNMVILDLGWNNFIGDIPGSIGQLKRLEELHLDYTSMSGELPSALGNCTSLKTISIKHNNFIGDIPGSIGQLKRLEELHLEYNRMSGELPSSLGNCTSLKIINFNHNNFTGELLKVNFSGLPNLKLLDLMSNKFTGEIPESVYTCSNLTTLQLSSNKFYGQLSPRIGNLKSLLFLSFDNNAFGNISNVIHALKNCRTINTLIMGTNFKGEAMPDDIPIVDGFQSLQVLSIPSCSLSGKMPLWLSKLPKLEVLDLSNNQLTGPIPEWFHGLNFLYFIDISNNQLTGDLPAAIMEMPMLQYEKFVTHLDPRVFEPPVYADYAEPSLTYGMANALPAMLNLGNDKLTGAIPSEAGQLKSLTMLNLSFNSFSGHIPPQLFNLTNLQVLDLSNNHLTGSIPQGLNNLHSLSIFDVSNNDLEGSVPIGYEYWGLDGNPKLCGPMLIRTCASTEAGPVFGDSREQSTQKTIFAIAFGAFFCVGVLYDQIVLSRIFSREGRRIGCPNFIK